MCSKEGLVDIMVVARKTQIATGSLKENTFQKKIISNYEITKSSSHNNACCKHFQEVKRVLSMNQTKSWS